MAVSSVTPQPWPRLSRRVRKVVQVNEPSGTLLLHADAGEAHRLRVADHVQRFFFNEGPLTNENAVARWRARMEEIKAQFLFEPRAAKAVFDDMVREAGVQVVFGERLDLKKGVVKEGRKIVKIAMESGREFTAKVFIDASYEGDVMAKAGVSYIVGRESNEQYGETLNGAFPFTPAPFPKIDPFIVPGDPKSGLLPRISATPPTSAVHLARQDARGAGRARNTRGPLALLTGLEELREARVGIGRRGQVVGQQGGVDLGQLGIEGEHHQHPLQAAGRADGVAQAGHGEQHDALRTADDRLVFATPIEDRWQAACRLLGVDLLHLSSDAGHAFSHYFRQALTAAQACRTPFCSDCSDGLLGSAYHLVTTTFWFCPSKPKCTPLAPM